MSRADVDMLDVLIGALRVARDHVDELDEELS